MLLLAEIREKQSRWPRSNRGNRSGSAAIRSLEPTGLLKLANAQIHENEWDACHRHFEHASPSKLAPAFRRRAAADPRFRATNGPTAEIAPEMNIASLSNSYFWRVTADGCTVCTSWPHAAAMSAPREWRTVTVNPSRFRAAANQRCRSLSVPMSPAPSAMALYGIRLICTRRPAQERDQFAQVLVRVV